MCFDRRSYGHYTTDMHTAKEYWFDPLDQSQPIVSPHAEIEAYRRKHRPESELRVNDLFLMSTTGCRDIVKLEETYPVGQESFLLPGFLGKRPIYTISGNTPISAVEGVLTSPVAADSLEVAIALGARKLFFFGFCGAISSDLEIGDIVVPAQIERLEGTSYHYSPADKEARPDSAMIEELISFLRKRSVPFHTGKTVTTDAVFRQTLNREICWREEGVLGVDMEMSALLTVAAFHGLESVCLLVVSDKHQLDPNTAWNWGGAKLEESRVRVLNLFVEFIRTYGT